jgi:hypothetical protein
MPKHRDSGDQNMKYRTQSVVIFLFAALGCSCLSAQVQAVRNDVPRIGQQEVLMMRHAYLDKGGYDYWFEQSSQNVWPWFERLGARMLGDFQIIYPESTSPNPDQDEAIRFARYASYEHWQATRPNDSSGSTGGSNRLAGDGELFTANNEGLTNRRTVAQGSRGGFFLKGHMATERPIYMPGLGENYQETNTRESAENGTIAVRSDRSEAREQILVLEYRKVQKGSFEELYALTNELYWPYLEKIGVRPVGQWQVAYLPNSPAVESADFDEVYTLARYASYEHYVAVRDDAVGMGGNGPDYVAMEKAAYQIAYFTQEHSREFLRGDLWGNQPHYTPAMDENYRVQN